MIALFRKALREQQDSSPNRKRPHAFPPPGPTPLVIRESLEGVQEDSLMAAPPPRLTVKLFAQAGVRAYATNAGTIYEGVTR